MKEQQLVEEIKQEKSKRKKKIRFAMRSSLSGKIYVR